MRNPTEPSEAGAVRARSRADRFLGRGSARLRYRDEGMAKGTAVLVLVHGWALDLESWDPQVRLLGDFLRLVRFDRRGFGLSSGAGGVDGAARDLFAILDACAVNSAFVVGMSQGARIALAAAQLHPGRVRGLVLDGAPAVESLRGAAHGDEVALGEYLRTLEEEGVAALQQQIGAHPFMQLRTHDPEARTLLANVLARYRGADLKQAQPVERHVNLAAISQPVLVINGRHDTRQRLGIGKAYAAALPRAEHVVLEAAGHLPNLDSPDEYSAQLAAFVARHT